jgi:hypothetical protein
MIKVVERDGRCPAVRRLSCRMGDDGWFQFSDQPQDRFAVADVRCSGTL